MDYILLKALHLLAAFLLFALLFGEYFLLKEEMPPEDIARLARIDGLYGFAALVLLAAGLLLWFWVGKPSEFYSDNPIFHLKVGLFVVVGITSIWPTMFYLRHRKSRVLVKVPYKIRFMIRMQMLLLVLMPVLAVLMANGVGLS